MKEREFNLLDEAWIRVRLPNNSIQEVSLTDALLQAHEYVDLAGETPAQDAAMLRLLLSIPLTIFYRVDMDGNAAPLAAGDEALLRWQSLWEQGSFPEKPLRDYLEKWHERFWLFHPKRPFWQVPEAAIGTKYGAVKLNGEISQSEHKDRMFLLRTGERKEKLTYSEAARWIVNIQSWDDVASKPGTGVGWLGKIGFIQATGHNLFETIVLNMTMLEDGQELWKKSIPQWERESFLDLGIKSAYADGFVDILTQPSRSLIILRNEDAVIGFACNGGYSFETRNGFSEQMTLWKKGKSKKNEPVYYEPARHDPAKRMWREFPSIINTNDDARIPGVVQWIVRLQQLKILNRNKHIHFKSAGVVYGSSNSSIADIFDDALSFQIKILDDLGRIWRIRISDEIKNCETAARYVGELQRDLAVAGGFSYSDKTKGVLDKQAEDARGDFYFAIDDPFRRWLRSIDTEADLDEKMEEWQGICRSMALDAGRRMVQESGTAAMLGHKAEIIKGKEELLTAPKAYNRFQYRIWNLYPKNQEEGGEMNG